MTWYYDVRQDTVTIGKRTLSSWGIIEVYPDLGSETEGFMYPTGATLEELVEDLEMMRATARGALEEKLPRGHIDRFWIPGAWLIHQGFLSHTTIVLDEDSGILLFEGRPSIQRKPTRNLTQWSFHPDSPVQDKLNA